MTLNLIQQLFGLTLLLTGMGVGYWLAARSYAGLGFAQKGILLLTVMTLAGGFFGALAWWFDVPSSFSWDLPPLASRMLASAGWSFAVACSLALRHPTQRHLRLIMLMLVVYLAPLAVAIVFFHLDRFDPTAAITYAFFIIVSIMTLPASYFLCLPVGITAETAADHQPPTRLVQIWLTLVAILTTLWGLSIFVTSQGPTPLIWAWPQDLLSSRLIGVMLLTIASAALYTLRYAYLARTVLATLAVYGIGLVAAGLWNFLVGKAIPLGYVVTFALLALGSFTLLQLGNDG